MQITSSKESRDCCYDVIKGIAIILVCIGHILQTTTSDFELAKVHSIIFAIQMPLFMILSGYFSINRRIVTLKEWVLSVWKRAIAYLVPFFSRFILFEPILNTHKVGVIDRFYQIFPSQIDNGLWFLWVIFFLYVSISLMAYLREKMRIGNNLLLNMMLDALVFGFTLLPWLCFAIAYGTSFLGAKFILYYSLFYFFGYCYRWYCEKYTKMHDLVGDIIAAIFLCVGLFLSCRFNAYSMDDQVGSITIRFVEGLTLSFALLYCITKNRFGENNQRIQAIGRHSLEIYYVHGIAFALLGMANNPQLYSIAGIETLFYSVVLTSIITYVIIRVIKCNRITDLLFFGRLKKMKE